MNIFKGIALALGLAGAMFVPANSEAAWPERPVSIVCSSSAGSANDLVMRQVASMLTQELGQPVLIVNENTTALSVMLHEASDGYTFGSVGASLLGYQMLTAKLSYKIEDIVPVSMVNTSCMAVICAPSKGWKTVSDAFKAAKNEKRPLVAAVMENLSRDILLKIAKQEGVELYPVPTKGGMNCLSAVLGGHADISIVGPIAVENTAAGKITTLASASSIRFEEMPDIPTLKEQGYDCCFDAFTTIVASAKVPQEAIDRMSEAMIKISAKPEYKAMLKKLAAYAAPAGKDAAAKAVAAEYADKKALIGK